MTTLPLLEPVDRRTAFRKVAKGREKTTRFISKNSDFLVNGFENSLWDYYFNWFNSCLLAGVCWHALLNTPRVILKKACCTASSPNNSVTVPYIAVAQIADPPLEPAAEKRGGSAANR